MHDPDVPAEPILPEQEIRELRERVEDQFNTSQILQRCLQTLLTEQDASVEPILLAEPIPPLFERQNTRDLEGHRFEPRIKPLNNKWWPTGAAEPEPLIPPTGWGSYTMRPAHAKALGISVSGMSRTKKTHIVDMIAERQRIDRDFRPIFLTDSTDFSIFAPYGFVAEYIPPVSKRKHSCSEMDWSTYTLEKRQLACNKWGLQEIIQFGPVEFGRF